MASHDSFVPPHPNMPITLVHDSTMDHDTFHFSYMMSYLEWTFGGYDPDHFTTSTDVCDQVYESASTVTLIFFY